MKHCLLLPFFFCCLAVCAQTKETDHFRFTITNFDDGWTSSIQPDWVQVVKGNIRVLIHYPNAATGKYIADRMQEDKMVWDLFIAPRYSNLSHYEMLKNNLSYFPVHFMAGNMTDASGNQVFVALFRKGGTKSNWIEIIAPDRQAFTQTFGIDKYDVYFDGWEPLAKLAGYNKFAVAPPDLTGRWTTNFSGMTQYVNAYTGADAGTRTYQSDQQYSFNANNHYHWEIHVVSGSVGALNMQKAKSDGSFTMPDNWKIHFSNLEDKPKELSVQFSAIKGARILWIDGQAYAKVE